jgi:spoIIIJ-associated protein
MPPAGPATAEAMASDLPTEFETHESPAPVEAPVHDSHEFAEPAPMMAEPGPAPRAPREERRPFRGADAEGPVLSSDELVATSLKVTEELFKAMGFEGKVTASLTGPDKVEVVAEVQDDEALLTGRKGETRQALQHLLNRMVNKGEGSRYHLQLEINDFWKHREEELAATARQMADTAVATGQEQISDFLNAQERRIVHVTLRDDTRVKTYSLGDGMIKRLAVAPAHAETMGGES